MILTTAPRSNCILHPQPSNPPGGNRNFPVINSQTHARLRDHAGNRNFPVVGEEINDRTVGQHPTGTRFSCGPRWDHSYLSEKLLYAFKVPNHPE